MQQEHDSLCTKKVTFIPWIHDSSTTIYIPLDKSIRQYTDHVSNKNTRDRLMRFFSSISLSFSLASLPREYFRTYTSSKDPVAAVQASNRYDKQNHERDKSSSCQKPRKLSLLATWF